MVIHDDRTDVPILTAPSITHIQARTTDFSWFQRVYHDETKTFGEERTSRPVWKKGGEVMKGSPSTAALLDLADAYSGFVRDYYMRDLSNTDPEKGKYLVPTQ